MQWLQRRASSVDPFSLCLHSLLPLTSPGFEPPPSKARIADSLTLAYLTLPYLTLPYLTLAYLTLPYLTLPYLT